MLTTRLLLNLTDDQVSRIEKFKHDGGFPSRLEAIRHLLEIGLRDADLPRPESVEAPQRQQRNVLTIPEILAAIAGRSKVNALEMMRAHGARENTRNWLLITSVLTRAGFVVGGEYGDFYRKP